MVHNQDCLEFIEWFCDQINEHDCDAVIFMGDWFHNRVRTETRTSHYSRIGIELLDAMNLPIYWILGNHEIYLRNSRDIHSLHHLGKYKNIRLIDTICQIDQVVFSPWLVRDEHENLKTMTGKYVFGHFELPFFLMNQVIEKIYDGHGPHIDDFVNFEAVYSGHFHKRQLRMNKFNIPVRYIGNCFGHDFNDVNDEERGMAILEWGETQPKYISWPAAPTYHRYNLSGFVEMIEAGKECSPRATIELIDDLNVPGETLNELKDLIECRQVRIRKPKQAAVPEETADVLKYKSLDEMIEHKLQTMIYDGKYEASLLIDLYRSV
jgi:DNA repair exonuclease SbcCD nuclease subunit